MPHETAAVSAQVLCPPYNHAPCHFMQSHIREVYACLALTCHLHFWQNDRDLLHATAVTWGWNGYRNKSQHKFLTLENKILPPLLRGLEPGTFRSRVRLSNYSAIPAPQVGQVTKMWKIVWICPSHLSLLEWTGIWITLPYARHSNLLWRQWVVHWRTNIWNDARMSMTHSRRRT